MAEGKKSFIAYSDWHGTFKALPDDIAGQLIKYIFSYVNDEKPKPHENFVINALFEQVKATLKRDLDKWEKQREQRSKAGKKSAELRKSTKSNERSTVVNEKVRKATVNDNVNVNVNNTTTKEAEIDFLKVDEWIKEIGKSEIFLEGLYRTHKLYKGSISELLNNFKEHLKIYPKLHNNFSDFKKHFASWLNIKSNKKELGKYQKQSKGQL